jgi:replication factor C subunit 3/5
MAARERLYELLINCIPAQVILKTMVMELLPMLDDSIKADVVMWAAFYEHRISLGSKEIFHLEAFIAKFMAIYKKYVNDVFGLLTDSGLQLELQLHKNFLLFDVFV